MYKCLQLFQWLKYSFFLVILSGCADEKMQESAWPQLKVSANQRYLEFADGQAFLWLGGTVWGMSEHLNREEIDYYLDDRKAKGFNLVQICLFWGKRVDDPIKFTLNPPNAYGVKAFQEIDGKPDPTQALVMAGGSPQTPNDYWDHVEYILQAAESRGMMMGLLPVWGRRYVNATHKTFGEKVFSKSSMHTYGEFLGNRFLKYSNIIWILGGDVKADDGGDYLDHYRAMAEGIIKGITKETIKWHEESPVWDYALMTYHPDGDPMKNSSLWFHQDAWLDFNMIETFKFKDSVYKAVKQDYDLADPIKPTLMGEPAYESDAESYGYVNGLDLRRQAYQSIFAGAAGFTYGAFRDTAGNGPLYSPFNDWKKLLDMEGAQSMQFVKSFSIAHSWPHWMPVEDIIVEGGVGVLQKLSVIATETKECFLYFPDRTSAQLKLSVYFEADKPIISQWYQPTTGVYTDQLPMNLIAGSIEVIPPLDWTDAILILSQ